MYESKKWQDVFSTGSPKAEREARISNAGGGGGMGTSERREWGMMGTSAVLERGVMGRENPCSPFVRAFPIRKRHSKVNLRYCEFHCYYSTRLNFSTVGEFSWN